MAQLFSLCLTVKHREKDNLILYRLADKLNNELIKFNPHEPHFELEYYDSRPNNPRVGSEMYQIDELKIWEWNSDSGWAKRTSIKYYELCASDDLMLNNEDDIRAKLKSGFHVSEYQNQNLLIKIGEAKDTYKVLVLDSDKLKVANGIAKIDDTIHILKGYIINKIDFLDTERITNATSIRYIYKFLELPKLEFELDTHTFMEKFSLWFNKQISLSNYSRKRKKETKDFFEETLGNTEEIKDFFDQNQFNVGNIDENIQEVRDQIEHVLSEDNQYDLFCERMIETLPKLTETFKLVVENNWRKDHESECKAAREELLTLTKQKSEMKTSYKIEKKNLVLLTSNTKIIRDEVEKLTTLQNNLQTSVNAKMEAVRTNIADFFAETMVYQSLTGFEKKALLPINNEPVKPSALNSVIHSLSKKTMDEAEVITTMNDLLYFLEINLKVAGVTDGFSSSLSQYITACMTQSMPLLLIGYGSKNVADAISVTLSGMTCDVITLTGGYGDFKTLSETILNCQSDVVLIENAIGYINEQIYMKLIKDITSKTLLFNVNFEDHLNFIPKSIFNYVNLLFLDNICGRKKQEEYILTNLSKDLVMIPSSLRTLKTTKDATHAVSMIIGMTKIYNSFRNELLMTMRSYDESNPIFSWLVFDVIPYMVTVGKEQETSDLIDSIQFTELQTKQLHSILKSDWL